MRRIAMMLWVGVAVAGLASATGAEASPSAPATGVAAPVYEALFLGGRCFYPDGWHGPGYYRCGFRYRRGLGFLGGGGGGRFGGHFGGGGGGHMGGGHMGGGHMGGGHMGGGHMGGGHMGGGHGGGGHGGHR